MRISMRIPKMSREDFTRLEEATRPETGKLWSFVELSKVGSFTATEAIDVDIKVEKAPLPHPTRNIVSREMLGDAWDLLGLFPSVEVGFPAKEAFSELDKMFYEIRALGLLIRDLNNPPKEAMATHLRNIAEHRMKLERMTKKLI